MNNSFTFLMLGACLFLLTGCGKKDSASLSSPRGTLAFELSCTPEGVARYALTVAGEPVITASDLGYEVKGDGSAGWMIAEIKTDKVRSEWIPVWGKRSVVPDEYNAVTVLFERNIDSKEDLGQSAQNASEGGDAPGNNSSLSRNTSAGLTQWSLECRLYDEGLAFRYHIPEGQVDEVDALNERTEFKFAEDPTAWFYNGEQANYGPVRLTEVQGVRASNVTLQVGAGFMNIHEADLRSGDPLKFRSEKGSSTLKVASSPGIKGKLKAGYTSPWRVVMYGKTPGGLVDSHLIELLNPPPAEGMDFSWVKPGVAVWDWRIDGAEWEGFTYKMDYDSWVRMIDFAAEQGMVALVLDANWYGPEHESASDPVKGDKAADVKRIISYGKEKGVGVWVYLNDVGGRKFPIENTLKQYGDWGAAGVKYGFMSGSPEEKNTWTQKITRLCAENKLLVDFHDGPIHPYGQMRTWPNAVTREFCHAQLDAHRVFEPSTFCTSVFVNMVTGPIDMNNGFFDLRQGKTTRVDESRPIPTTVVAEAARTQIVFSGATIIPDIPEYYHQYPSLLRFIAAQKMPWKESKTLQGEIGKYIVMARQSAQGQWLVGAATNEDERTLTLPLSFLPAGNYSVEITEDGDKAHFLNNKTEWKSTTQDVTPSDTLTLKLAPGGGACLLFTEKK